MQKLQMKLRGFQGNMLKVLRIPGGSGKFRFMWDCDTCSTSDFEMFFFFSVGYSKLVNEIEGLSCPLELIESLVCFCSSADST